MKHRNFYSHIVDTSTLSLELGDMDLAQEERVELIALIDSNLHQVVLDAVLSELSEEDKKVFLKHVHINDHDQIWKFLNSKAKNIEEKIVKAAGELKKELHKDIKVARLLSHKK